MSLSTAAWHQHPGALARFVADLIVDEVAHLRPGAAALPPGPWPDETLLGEGGLGLDSLERMSVAAALNEALHIHETGIEDLLLVRTTFGEWLRIASRALAQFNAQLSFRGTDSSGAPQACTHTLSSLQQQARVVAARMRAADGVAQLPVPAAVPAHQIDGFLYAVLLPIELGATNVD